MPYHALLLLCLSAVRSRPVVILCPPQPPSLLLRRALNTEIRPEPLGKDLIKLFKILRQRTAQGGTSFGRVIDGDLRVTEFGSWLQPTYLQRLSVTHGDARPPRCRGPYDAHGTRYLAEALDALTTAPTTSMPGWR